MHIYFVEELEQVKAQAAEAAAAALEDFKAETAALSAQLDEAMEEWERLSDENEREENREGS